MANPGVEDEFSIGCPYLHAASVALPIDDSDFGFEISERLGALDAQVSLVEFAADGILKPGQGRFTLSGIPLLEPTAFSEYRVAGGENVIETAVGEQRFFTVNGRMFALYVVLGSNAAPSVVTVNTVLTSVRIDPNYDTYRSRVLVTPGCVAYWRLGEEAAGTAIPPAPEPNARDTKGTNHGLFQGSGYGRGEPPLIQNSVDKASRNAQGTYVRVPDAASLRFTTKFSLEGWIKPTTLTTAGSQAATIVGKVGEYFLKITQAGEALCGYVDAGGQERQLKSAPGAVSVDQVTHLVGTFDGTTLRVYVNGASVAESAAGGSIASRSNPVQIGSYGAAQFYAGVVDEVAVYAEPMSPDRVSDHSTIGFGTAGENDPYAAIITQTDGLEHYWRLGEGVNDGVEPWMAADSFGGSDGTFMETYWQGSGWHRGQPRLIANTFDYSSRLDGGWVQVPHTDALNHPGSFSIEGWCQPSTLPWDGGHLFGKQAAYWLYVLQGGKIGFGVLGGGSTWSREAVSPAMVDPGETWHLVGTCDGATIRLYANGQQVAQTALPGIPQNSTHPLDLGRYGSGGMGYFRGILDDLAFYSSALTPEQVLEHYEWGTDITLPQP